MRRYIVTGARDWEPRELIRQVLWRIHVEHGPDVTIVHGACHLGGVDRVADEEARAIGMKVEPHPARGGSIDFGPWPGCGPRRNAHMASLGADACLAFHRDIMQSKGTLDMARKAVAAGIPTFLYDGRGRPRILTNADLYSGSEETSTDSGSTSKT